MKPDWDKLMADFADSSVVGVYDVDCTTRGKALCQQAGVRGYPTILHGDPSNIKALAKYNGARTFDALSKFAKATLLDGQPVAPPAPPPKPTGMPTAKPTAKPMAKPGQPKPNAGKGAKGAPGKGWPNRAKPGQPKPNAGKGAKGASGKGWPNAAKAPPKAPVKPMAGSPPTGKPTPGKQPPGKKQPPRMPSQRKPDAAGAKPFQGKGKVPTPAPRPHRKNLARGAMGAHDPAEAAARQAAARRQAASRTSKMGVLPAGGKMGLMGPAATKPVAGARASQRRAAAERRAAAQKKLHGKHQADKRLMHAHAAARRQAANKKEL